MDCSYKLYLLLEVEKVKQNHRCIPSTFIYPTGGLSFSCVTYEENTRILYNVSKNSMEDPWVICILNKRPAKELFYESDCLYDTLLHFTRFIKTTACADVDYETEVWNSTRGLEESLNALGRFKR